LEEYRLTRVEVQMRAGMLHNMLSLGAALQFLSAFVYFAVPVLHSTQYLLILPIFFSVLTFNYQANQMTLEELAR
jgi:hypothetical protein